jgi:hypothetical protein
MTENEEKRSTPHKNSKPGGDEESVQMNASEVELINVAPTTNDAQEI